MTEPQIFSQERAGDALIVVIHGDVGSLADDKVIAEFDVVVQSIRDSEFRSIVLDFSDVEYFGSSVLEGLRLLWKGLQPVGAKMALCGLSKVGVEILQVVNFDRLWPICANRAEALERLKS